MTPEELVRRREKRREYKREYYRANQEKLREYREANREKRRAYEREYYKANQEKLREYGRKYHAANQEKLREYGRKYRTANRQKADQEELREIQAQVGRSMTTVERVRRHRWIRRIQLRLDHAFLADPVLRLKARYSPRLGRIIWR